MIIVLTASAVKVKFIDLFLGVKTKNVQVLLFILQVLNIINKL